MQEQIDAIQKTADTLIEFIANYSVQVLGAIVIIIVGLYVARWASRIVSKFCEKREIDVTLADFLARSTNLLVITFVVIIALGKFGITIAPFIAAIGAGAFGISFAVQGPLSNYGAGLVIILARFFTVGDTITVKGVHGVVEEVKLGHTLVIDEDGVKITIPNRHVVGEIIHNSGEHRIVEAVVGISYTSDANRAIEVVKATLDGIEEVAKDPQYQVGIEGFGDSSVNIGFRYWVPTIDYFKVSYRANLAVYDALGDAGITIPFPQRDVHIISQPSAA